MQTFQISDEIAQKLDVIAHKMHQSKEACVKKAILSFLEDQEDYFLAVEALEDQDSDDNKTYTLEELRAELELERARDR